MALYRQQSEIQNHLGDYATTRTSNTGSCDQVNNDVRKAQQKQSRHYRRLVGYSKQKMLINIIITILCFGLATSTYIFLSRDYSPDPNDTSMVATSSSLKFAASNCDVKLLNSTMQLVEPPKSRKFARFSLSYTQKEETPNGVDYWEPRFAGNQSLREREDSFLVRRDHKINCGFIKGPNKNLSPGFDLTENDRKYIKKCHIAVVSCIFGNYDRLRPPYENVISHLSRKIVCFVMFMDEKTLQIITSEGQIPNRMGFIGTWKIVVVKNFPFTDMKRVQKIPKLLLHRLFPNVRYSMWVDSKLRLEFDPLLLLERFLWRKGYEYAVFNHYARHCVWEEAERNKVLNRANHTLIDHQMQFYEADGLKRFNASDPGNFLPSNLPESCVIIREHTPMSNLFSCLWYNEVDRFTYRDQLSFFYTYQKLVKKNPSKTFHLHMFKVRNASMKKVNKIFPQSPNKCYILTTFWSNGGTYIEMEDCERRRIVKTFIHKIQEKHNTAQNAKDSPWRILNYLSKGAKERIYKTFVSHK